MKKYFFPLIISVLLAQFITSCNGSSNHPANLGDFELDSLVVHKTEHYKFDSKYPSAKMDINFAYIKSSPDKPLMDSVNQILMDYAFAGISKGSNCKDVATQYADTFFHDFQKDGESLGVLEQGTDGESYFFEKTVTTKVLNYVNNLLVYSAYQYIYTGGAHGSYGTSYANIDLMNHSVIKLANIFLPDTTDKLTELIYQQLMKDNKVNTKQELLDMGYGMLGDITPTENFAIGKESITFLYNIYEIAPYAMGEIEVTIPYTELKSILNTKYLHDLDSSLFADDNK